MKSMKWSIIVAFSFLVLTIDVLPTTNSFLSTVQSQSNPPNLEDSVWLADIVYQLGRSNLSVGYVFRKQGKVNIIAYRAIEGPVVDKLPQSNRYYEAPPIMVENGDGTYEQNGSGVHLEFSDHTIDAIIKGNLMEGFITRKESNERWSWDAEKVPETSSAQPARRIDNEQKYRELIGEAIRLERQKKYREAIEKYTAAISLNPSEMNKLFAYRNRGNANVELENWRVAISDYDLFFQLYEANVKTRVPGGGVKDIDLESLLLPDVLNKRGIAKYRLGKKGGACEDFRRSCELNGSSKIACENFRTICN